MSFQILVDMSIEDFKNWIEKNADILSKVDSEGRTPLTFLLRVRTKDPKITLLKVKLIAEKRPELLNQAESNDLFATPLIIAINNAVHSEAFIEIAKYILDACPEAALKSFSDKLTPLMVASYLGQLELVIFILNIFPLNLYTCIEDFYRTLELTEAEVEAEVVFSLSKPQLDIINCNKKFLISFFKEYSQCIVLRLWVSLLSNHHNSLPPNRQNNAGMSIANNASDKNAPSVSNAPPSTPNALVMAEQELELAPAPLVFSTAAQSSIVQSNSPSNSEPEAAQSSIVQSNSLSNSEPEIALSLNIGNKKRPNEGEIGGENQASKKARHFKF